MATRRPSTTKPGRLRTFRSALSSWSDRPMTSLHLIIALTAVLLVIGLLMVLSASSIVSVRRGNGVFSVFTSQAIFAGAGIGAFIAAMFLPTRLLRSAAFPAVLLSLLALALVLVIGARINGARSWFQVAGVSLQPSEVAKVALLIWMGHVMASRRHTLRSLKQLLVPVLPVFALMVGLIMLQPDLGTTVSLTLIFLAVLFFAGAPLWVFGSLLATAVAGLIGLAIAEPYRLQRVLAYLDPNNPENEAATYQLNQGLYGMGSGGIFGTGIGQSQVKWSALPQAESDFIFAIIGEEMGLIGTGLVVFLYAMLAYTGLRIARRNVDPFIRIVAGGATVWLVGQACINIGYVVGLLPVTGLTLPMISAGGTSLLVTMFVLGILANFARQEPAAAAALYAQGPGPIGRFLGLGRAEPGADTESPARKEKRAKRARRQAAKLAKDKQRKAARADKFREKAQRTDVRGSQGPTRRPTGPDPRRTGSDRRPTQRRTPDSRDPGRRPSTDRDANRRQDPRDAEHRRTSTRPRSNDPAPAGNGRRAVTPSRPTRRPTEGEYEPRARRTGERTVRP